ncbi:apoptosis regulatory protein Siva isoform X2 [Plodia interpunctella]|uniref:apoptosis regulatory protein Siva isoform X2 n=1 Tax=Plodia interpunctella TaxID=58824 RepID=UPI002367D60A|nr:apoptosis regulatory protein Siva isoform X2 [Plodia interpunctella]
MAKRSNPFIEDFMPQSKVHVGIKQFNNNKDRLQSVYEKTLDLLFTGAKKCPRQNVVDDTNTATLNKRDNMKQLYLGKDGSLLHSGTFSSSDKVSIVRCSCGGSKETICGYCEKVLCDSCQHLCDMMEQKYAYPVIISC